MDDTRDYFDHVAPQWDEMRRRFFGDGVRKAAIEAAGIGPGMLVADVGTGTGFLAEHALDAGAQVVGIDFSDAMLDEVRARFAGRPFEGRLGDTAALPMGRGEVDAVLGNMVLHHAEDPPAAIREMARVLRPGGRLVITDADSHSHEWLRTEQHDRWLGFDRADIRRWFHQAGLDAVTVGDTHEICSPTSACGTEAAITIFIAQGRKPICSAGLRGSAGFGWVLGSTNMDADRRAFLRAAAAVIGGAGAGPASAAGYGAAGPAFAAGQAPAIVTADAARPSAAFGATAGDVDADRAIIWSRTDRPARLVVEYSTTESFSKTSRILGPAALEATDFTARVDLSGLPEGQRIFYRARFQSLKDLSAWSEPIAGTFTTPPSRSAPRDVTVAWTADTVGQGWGIDPAMGGMRLYEAMRQAGADVFIHTGDTIYADAPLQPEVKLDDGRVWRNLVTPEKSKVAETLDEFRGNHRYNLLDEHVRRFNASLSQFVIWDDHEVLNNWYPTEVLGPDGPHTERSVALLAARAKRAFQEYTPMRFEPADPERIYRACRFGPLVDIFGFDMRSYRGANSTNRQTVASEESALLGATQVEWLKRRLLASSAIWKIVASDMPLGLTVPDGAAFEAVANGDPGPPLGRELELASLLRFIRDRRVRNVVFVTGDVHYCAAHHYDPSRATFTEFNPFWEFVAGPAHAGTFGPATLDRTFGPEVKFIGIPRGMKGNRPPSDGLQFFGTLRVDAKTHALTATLRNAGGDRLYMVELPEEGAR